MALRRKMFFFKKSITDSGYSLATSDFFWGTLFAGIVFISLVNELRCQTSSIRLSNYGLEKQANYGWSCATNGNFVVAGGPNVSYSIRAEKVTEGGKVIIYEKINGKWVLVQELHNPAMDDYGWFGSDVEMNEMHLVISAHGYSEKENAGDHSHRLGMVYIYRLKENHWIRSYSIQSPKPSKNGSFGKLIHLKGDTLAVFYEHGDNFSDYANQQCIVFYHIGAKEAKPFRIVCVPKGQTPIYDFSFDFNQEELIIGKGCTAYVAKFGSGNIPEISDSIDFCHLKNFEGSITSVKLSSANYFVGFHEHMYYFWGYSPVGNIAEGDSLIGKTVIDPKTGKQESFILTNDPHLLKEYEVSPAFFQEHGRVYESYQSRAKRKAGAGSVFIYTKSDDKLILKQELTASTRHAEDWFGHDIAISKENLLISALGYPDQSENHEIYNKRFSGAVFHFTLDEQGVWQEQQIYRSVHEKRWDKFGFSLNNRKDFFVIGSRFDDYNIDGDAEQGAVYILGMDEE